MTELKMSPDELFKTYENTQITINGIPTQVLHMNDERGNFFAIRATHKDLSDICGDLVLGKLITEINYAKYNGRVAIIKAYYR
ncbi:MAG: hypothetical protein ACLRZ7_01005 [Lachnospiraceae bacterium]